MGCVVNGPAEQRNIGIAAATRAPVARFTVDGEEDPRRARGIQRGGDQRLSRYGVGVERIGGARVLVHQAREQLLVEAAPVDARSSPVSRAGRRSRSWWQTARRASRRGPRCRVDAVFREDPRAFRVLVSELCR